MDAGSPKAVDGGGRVVGAHLLRVAEGGSDALPARGQVGGIVSAERERAHHAGSGVGRGVCSSGEEELRGGGGVCGEGGVEHGQVGMVGAVGRVVAAAAADDPDRRRRRRRRRKSHRHRPPVLGIKPRSVYLGFLSVFYHYFFILF